MTKTIFSHILLGNLLPMVTIICIVGCGKNNILPSDQDSMPPSIREITPPSDEFWEAVKEGTVQDVKHHIENLGVNINVKNNELDMTPLHYAVGMGNISVAKYLIEKGADVNAKHSGGWTPLHFAGLRLLANDSMAEIVILLEEKGADFNAKDNQGKTPLDIMIDIGGAVFEVFTERGNPKAKEILQRWENKTNRHGR
jgi:hypothetical protein